MWSVWPKICIFLWLSLITIQTTQIKNLHAQRVLCNIGYPSIKKITQGYYYMYETHNVNDILHTYAL